MEYQVTDHSHDVFPSGSEQDVTEDDTEGGQRFLMSCLDLQPAHAAQMRHQVVKCSAMMKRQRIDKWHQRRLRRSPVSRLWNSAQLTNNHTSNSTILLLAFCSFLLTLFCIYISLCHLQYHDFHQMHHIWLHSFVPNSTLICSRNLSRHRTLVHTEDNVNGPETFIAVHTHQFSCLLLYR